MSYGLGWHQPRVAAIIANAWQKDMRISCSTPEACFLWVATRYLDEPGTDGGWTCMKDKGSRWLSRSHARLSLLRHFVTLILLWSSPFPVLILKPHAVAAISTRRVPTTGYKASKLHSYSHFKVSLLSNIQSNSNNHIRCVVSTPLIPVWKPLILYCTQSWGIFFVKDVAAEERLGSNYHLHVSTVS